MVKCVKTAECGPLNGATLTLTPQHFRPAAREGITVHSDMKEADETFLKPCRFRSKLKNQTALFVLLL